MESAHAQVGGQLRLMRWQDGGNRFDLEDDLACNNDVSSEPLSDRHGFVDDRDGNLSFEWNAPFAQLMTQALLVTDSSRPGPVFLCTSLASLITCSVNALAITTSSDSRGPSWPSVLPPC